MIVFILGLLIFFGVHLIPTEPNARVQMIDHLGATQYRISFTLASLLGLGLIIWGFSLAEAAPANMRIWSSPHWMRHVTILLMAPAFILFVAAYIPCRIRDKIGPPMLASVILWAFAHLLSNGDLVGIILFSSFLVYAIYDLISVKKRHAQGPLGDRHGKPLNDFIAIGIGLAAWALMLFGGHKFLIGLSLLS